MAQENNNLAILFGFINNYYSKSKAE
jgi:hypothetical protein